MTTWTIILAAGSGSRLASSTSGIRKQFLSWRGAPLYWHSAQTFAAVPTMAGLVFVFPPEEVAQRQDEIASLSTSQDLGIPLKVVAGGDSRRESSRLGLETVPASGRFVLVHDAARPFVTPGLVSRVIESLLAGATAVVPALPVKDTIRMEGPSGLVTLDRSKLLAVQTPQGFPRDILAKAHHRAAAEGWSVTDDASMTERLGEPVTPVSAEASNIKITTPEDLALLAADSTPPVNKVGWGYDVHRFGPGRPLVIGGVPIPSGPEVQAHSDGDVLLHALIDGLLGCLGRGDIGDLFPDTDPAYEGISSGVLLNEVLALVQQSFFVIDHVDLTVIAQVPRLSPFKAQIRKNVSALLALDLTRVNLKATTEEGLGFTGEKKGIKAVAVVTGHIEPDV